MVKIARYCESSRVNMMDEKSMVRVYVGLLLLGCLIKVRFNVPEMGSRMY